jgi:hypothetical protein
MEEKENFTNVKTRFLNLILDHGVSLSITVAFCFALYYILHEHNKLIVEQLFKLIEEKKTLTNQLLECYKYKNE